jgi:hypothetical protein
MKGHRLKGLFSYLIRLIFTMKYGKIFSTLLLSTIALSALEVSAANPGKVVMECVETERERSEYDNGDELEFQNTCGFDIFVIYCGDLRYSDRECGDGPDDGYYTHSRNIEAGDSYSIDLDKGQNKNVSYGACKGGISFGNDGHYKDFPNASFNCMKTGHYRDD